MLDPTMDKLRLLDLIRMEHAFLMRALAGLMVDEMGVPGVVGEWSVKDILAHITTWEQRFLKALAVVERGEAPEWPEAGYTWDDLDALNARDYSANQDRPLAEVWADFERSFAELLDKTASMPDAALLAPGYYDWTGEHALWRYLDANAGDHYREHAEQIRQWRGSRQ
jgi:hypothetical protein